MLKAGQVGTSRIGTPAVGVRVLMISAVGSHLPAGFDP
ncbi:uncharacterized protein METZ01_LOCUS316899 [marine metagenome]|uniref:Uncharacterized protein n=1 Tax=marine metagenome TaxID=408172 RepID=A0A382NUM4_9ZZZZ